MASLKITRHVSVLVLFCLSLSAAQLCQDTEPCYPPVKDLSTGISTSTQRTLTVSSTCGDPDPTTYKSLNTSDDTNYTCSVVTNGKGNMVDKTIRTIPTNNVTLMSPSYGTYWQSINTVTSSGGDPIAQDIIFNFTDVLLIREFLITFTAPNTKTDVVTDGRPSSMSVERRVDGNWKPWRYFADNCAHLPGVAVYNGTDENPFAVNCRAFERDAGALTFEKNLHQLKLDPSTEFEYEFLHIRTVMDYFSTSAIRIRLTRPANMDPTRSYYAVADVTVEGYCLCYGHAVSCTGENENKCVCGHNTEGDHCERCLPLYNNKPWAVATPGNPAVCELCNCNKHAGLCVYDPDKGHGVCSDCKENTGGDNCNDCARGYFINPSQLPNATVAPAPDGTLCSGHDGAGNVNYDCNSYCIACDCSGGGTVLSSNYICNSVTGQCECKEYVQGRTCSECKDGYHTLVANTPQGCQACQCEPVGTFNNTNYCNKTTGQCICKTNTEGTGCERCKPETYDLKRENIVDGCTPCECDVGGAVDNACNVDGGQCSCRNRLSGRDCSEVTAGYFVPKLDYFTFDAEFATIAGGNIVEEPGHGQLTSSMTGLGYVQLTPGGTITLEGQLPAGLTQPYEVLVRYKSSAVQVAVTVSISMKNGVEYICNGQTVQATNVWEEGLALTGPETKSHKAMTTPVCMKDQQTYVITVTSLQGNTDDVLIDSVVLLPYITHLTAYANSNNDVKTMMASCRDFSKNVDLGQRAASNCSRLEYSLMAELFNGALPCNCDTTGTVPGLSFTCDRYGGQCTCKDSFFMRNCSLCKVDSYSQSGSGSCIACNCDVQGSVNLFCNNTGHCDCKTNVTGVKCNECLLDNYGLQTGNGCTLCQCELDYSYNNSCLDDGQCPCKPGVGGQNCDTCQDGFFNLTADGCTICGCDVNGAVSGTCHKTTGACTCKNNVQGEKCTECKQGFFGLGSWAVEGCLQCQCSGHTANCTTAEGWFRTITESHWPLSDEAKAVGARWLGQDDKGNDVTVNDPIVFGPPGAPLSAQYVMRIVNSGNNLNQTNMYFLAPSKFLGNKRTAYGLRLIIELRTSSNESILSGYTEGDVILKGQYLSFSLTRNLSPTPGMQITKYEIILDETGWYVDSTTGPQATYQQMIDTLASLASLKIRGKFSNKTDAEVDLFRVIMEHATKDNASSDGVSINNVEHCYCPDVYRGDSCELCGFGYRRKQSFSGARGECESCGCNSHAGGPCDFESGVCNCTHNTTGSSCDVCLPGFYGNPLNGQPDDCKPCTCPGDVKAGDVNVFAQQCNLDSATGGPVCINCSVGHEGNMCDVCIVGYYGQPTNASNNNGKCTPCVCNGRADTCDRVTGVCTGCRNNTAGKECNECAPSFFGNPSISPCTPCTCNASVGATGECNHRDGSCTCKTNVIGFGCDQCVQDAFNFTGGEGCTMCDCHPEGSTATSCAQDTGQCSCRTANVLGRKCDTCADGTWNLNSLGGCDPCFCNPNGIDTTSGGKCDQVTGQCTCKNKATIGRTCDQCSKVSFGSFPNCGLCGECFDSWAEKMDAIGKEVFDKKNEVDAIWQNYNRWTSSHAESFLSSISANISLAENSIHRVGNFTQLLSSLEASLQEISARANAMNTDIDTLQQRYNTSAESYQNLTLFTGQVAIDNVTIVTLTSLNTSIAETTRIINNRYQTGNATWQRILGLSLLVSDTGEESRRLQTRVNAAMRELTIALETYSLIVKIYNESFLTGYKNNDIALKTARGIQTDANKRLNELKSIMSFVSGQYILANATMNSINSTSRSQRGQMIAGSEQSRATSALAAQVLQEAKDTLTVVEKFLTIARESRGNITHSFYDVIEGINSLSELMSKMSEIENDGVTIRAIFLPPLADLNVLTNNISQTVVDVDAIAQTNEKANAALDIAKTAVNKTSQARDDSLRAAEEVEGIQTALNETETLRSDVTNLKSDSDAKNQTVYNVIATVQANSNQLTSLAVDTSVNIDNVFNFIRTVKKCYIDRSVDAGGSRRAAQDALAKADEASQKLGDLNSLISTISSRVSPTNVSADLTSIENTNAQLTSTLDSFKRVENVTSVQALLQNYLNQKQEVDTLEAELIPLESQLDKVTVELNTRVVTQSAECTIN